ncbi:MAG: hypothetical protein HYX63_15250 [Gammaproteobacteria bacterium]|nr:hypothetical protein [Gammaproteobacteria bacterium]
MRALSLAFLLVLSAVATAADPTAAFTDGMRAYEHQDYAAAADAFQQAATAAPTNDEYLHWLGKAYGRQAEQAGWFEAAHLATLTREAFERAVSLNPNNTSALADLADYYAAAPAFLGGDEEKARRLRERLKRLTGNNAAASTSG